MSTGISEKTPRKLVVVGGGIGGLSSAFDARHILRSIDKIVVVSDRDDFQFTPSNPWVATRKRSPKDISLPLATVLPRHNVDFVKGKVVHLDPKNQQLRLEDGTRMDYDFLIIATGPRLAFDEVPGAGPDGHSNSICITSHASEAADAFDELATNPGPLVIGATQGSSCFGPAYEFAMITQHELQKRGGKKLVEQCKITFVTPEPYIGHLGLKGAGDSKEILSDLMDERGIEYITNCRVNKVLSDSVHITYMENHSEQGKATVSKKRKLPSRFTMLIPPFRGMSIWSSVPGLTDKMGLIVVDKHQQSPKYPNIFGVGVCVSIPPLEDTPVPTGVPKTGYMIESMGTAAVKNIRSIIDFEETKPLEETTSTPPLHHVPLLNGLCITDFGDDGAIFLSMPQVPPRRYDITIHGKVATLSKIAFEKYFLHKIESGDTDPYYEKYMLMLIGVERTVAE